MNLLLDVVIGLISVLLLFSILISGLNEWLAHAFARRGAYLRLGLRRLIADEAVFRRVLEHPLLASSCPQRRANPRPPSYVEPHTLSLALVDVLLARAAPQQRPPVSAQAVQQALASPALCGSPIAIALRPLLAQAGDDMDKVHRGIEAWFSAGMDRVSGWYKARTRSMLFAIGLAVAALCNIDAIAIAARLNESASLRQHWAAIGTGIAASGQTETPALRQALAAGGAVALPIGHQCLVAQPEPGTLQRCWRQLRDELAAGDRLQQLLKLLGWVLTAMAGTMGAGYWFAALSKVVNIRGAGPKPASA